MEKRGGETVRKRMDLSAEICESACRHCDSANKDPGETLNDLNPQAGPQKLPPDLALISRARNRSKLILLGWL